MELKDLRVAIVHDWLVSYAGADRVVDQMHQVFPQAVIYTLVYNPGAFPEHFQKYDVRTTFVQKIPFARKLYKNLLTLMPKAFESLDLTEYDLVISSCSSCSKGVITRPDTLHVCYCNTPIRYVWSHYHEYLRHASLLKRLLIPHMLHKLRVWDFAAAQRVDVFFSNSRTIQQRVKKYYRRESTVLYPGVRMDPVPAEEKDDGYYLMVGRFVHYKRFDLGIEACNRLGRRLIVAGGGDEEKALHRLAGPTVEFRTNVKDEEIRELYRHAKALIFPGEEDFGIVPVEAQSSGCPVVAYGRGGAGETVTDGVTGVLIDEQTPEKVMAGMERLEREGIGRDRGQTQKAVQRFSEQRFCEELAQRITEAMEGCK